jgi:hypothetical protein
MSRTTAGRWVRLQDGERFGAPFFPGWHTTAAGRFIVIEFDASSSTGPRLTRMWSRIYCPTAQAGAKKGLRLPIPQSHSLAAK